MGNIKTNKGWNKSSLDLRKYLGEVPCEIDEELYLYLGEVVSPQYSGNGFIQSGEPVFKENGIYFYFTCREVEGSYYYLGILPEFDQF